MVTGLWFGPGEGRDVWDGENLPSPSSLNDKCLRSHHGGSPTVDIEIKIETTTEILCKYLFDLVTI